MSKEKGETQKAMEEKLEQINATRYSEADLVSFGEYLLSAKREGLIRENHPVEEGEVFPDEILRGVYHADLENWKETTPQF